MNKRIKLLRAANNFIYQTLDNATHGSLNIIDNQITFEGDGMFMSLRIFFKGNASIFNELPEGYSININRNIIRISKFRLKGLVESGLLFQFSGNMKIQRAEARSFLGDIFQLDINDIDKQEEIGESKTKVEDDGLILQESPPPLKSFISNNKIDDNSIKGLFNENKFANGYSGAYSYHPNEKIFTTGRQTTNESTPISNPNIKLAKIRQEKAMNKLAVRQTRELKLVGLDRPTINKKANEVRAKEIPTKITARILDVSLAKDIKSLKDPFKRVGAKFRTRELIKLGKKKSGGKY